jgi:3',5'-cyclic AMP phosphodiesterase CpdA
MMAGKWKIFLIIFFCLILLGGGVYFFQKHASPQEKPAEKSAVEIPLGEKSPAGNSSAPPMFPVDENPKVEEAKNEAADDSFSFAILGDTQRFDPSDPAGGLQRSIAVLEKKAPSFLVAIGDLVSSCDGGDECESHLSQWKNALGRFFPKTYAIMGNHDRTGKGKADELWQKFFAFPANGPEGFKELAYSFDFNDAHCVFLDSEKPEEHLIDKVQRDWLEADLAKNDRKFTFVFFHEPAFPVKSKIEEGLDAEPQERDALWKILERHRVTAVFSGHEHIQNHKKIGSIDQFIFGNTDSFDHEIPSPSSAEFSYQGEGFGLVTVSKNSAQADFYAVSGELLKTFFLEK